jgi:anti-anti-sigma regulatory factor
VTVDPASSPGWLSVETRPGVVVVVGELDLATVPAVTAALRPLVRAGGDVRIDVRGATFIGSAFTYADLSELVTTYERLKATGISPSRCMNHGSSMSLYYADPDGNQIELKVDNFDTYEEQHAWMRSEAFAQNPIGAPFDMGELAAQLKAGVPARQLVKVAGA